MSQRDQLSDLLQHQIRTASRLILGASIVLFLAGWLEGLPEVSLAAVASATGAALIVLPGKPTFRGIAALWGWTALIAGSIIGASLAAHFLIDRDSVRLTVHAVLLTIVSVLALAIERPSSSRGSAGRGN